MSESARVSKMYVGLLLGAIAVLGLTMFQASLYSNYGMSTEDLDYLDVSNQVMGGSGDLKENIESTYPTTGIAILDQFIAGTYNTLKLFFDISDIYGSFISVAASGLGVPGVFVTFIVAIISLTVIFQIIRIITKMEV